MQAISLYYFLKGESCKFKFYLGESKGYSPGFLSDSAVKNLPAMQETPVSSLGQKDLPEEGMTTHSSILAWRIPRTEEPGGLQSMGSQSQKQLKRLSMQALKDYHPGDSTSRSSEKQLQRRRGKGQYTCGFGGGEIHAIKHILFFICPNIY